ncbi:sugar phosphate isomerase/epimerase family protein [Salinibacterium sp. PAMC 21357]|uniref:sugar phosphate isomerase/epimerase family protein n=1 Tax=Salinibacterium sp. PAMC 21357 TaxID=1112215 RepID=UPI000289C252|nr:TIM barrel protein [Salinibacterium sp. PAMC 21357]
MSDNSSGESAYASSASWPIAAAMLPFAASHDARPEAWFDQLAQVAFEGIDSVDVTDNWVQAGDLSSERLEELSAVIAEAHLRPIAISAIRRSVIDPVAGDDNLAYSHRTLDAAASLGIPLVSFGLHRPLLPGQKTSQWFWTEPGPVDDQDDATWDLATTRIRELGKHAADLGIAVSLEMYEDTLIGTVDGGLRLVESVGLSNVGLNPDLGNMYRLHRDIEDFLEASARCAPVSNYWHVKNYFRDEDRERGFVTTVPAPMEFGSMNYRAAIAAAIAAGFAAPFCVEHYGGDGLSVAARNADYVRRMIAVALGEARTAVRGLES